MYELLILGSLVQRDMSGYKLRCILQNSMIPRRPISNSVIYPVLKKMAELNYIELYDEEESEHAGKMAHITSGGVNYLQELMLQPVEMTAKRESIYRCKLRALAAVSLSEQIDILQAYYHDVDNDMKAYREVEDHLTGLLSIEDTKKDFLKWSIKNIELAIKLTETTLDWLRSEINEIEESIGE
ncbi:transcriptional regulator PadR-like family protein [Paucilactobacillus oligofermentans DSM 15707 = LMG 22743]|uniref:Transcriptional regulator PadR-like family protein n=1 Tax=Paucilactobacillus oligofermentans DSM 15707 = LMG 22743 TaxID=1423778 RepID=A0A0R1REB3_9LACO|nr:PadR family transcriptional regulator [Paucilactobacillus oligofermentans]KRL55392.1 transcriptional regulator PadR-like family protein [Paucilactobacillus oligofermentans DSM 15707 = LMG 22743]CUS25618.1 Putative PadR-like transcription regulator [Paucilactobacillus oligofermentans DSM 15707 = LMG 22743]